MLIHIHTYVDMLTPIFIYIHIYSAYTYTYLCRHAHIYMLVYYCTWLNEAEEFIVSHIICLYHPSFLADRLDYILCLYRAVVSSCWLAHTCTSEWRGPLENIAYEFILTSPAGSCMSCSSYMDGIRDGR